MPEINTQEILVNAMKTGVLVATDIACLTSVSELPDETDVNDYKLMELSPLFMKYEDEPKKLEMELHKIAQKEIIGGNFDFAWKILLAFNNE